jgi:hypothetical protein
MGEYVRWADVPHEQRRRHPIYSIGGCAYAVPLKDWHEKQRCGGEGYRPCGNAPRLDSDACFNHTPRLRPSQEMALTSRAKGPVNWALKTDGLAGFRLTSDDDLFNYRNVGVKLHAKLIEIRDTWTDDDVVKLAGFDPRGRKLPPIQPFVSFSAIDVMAYVGE